MRTGTKNFRLLLVSASAAAALLITGCGAMEKMGMGGTRATTGELSGKHEVPPVTTKASGKSTITVASDKTVSGSVIVDDITPTAAHIHRGAPGTNGPVIIPLTKTADKTWSVPPNARLTDEQFAAFKEGNLYINVHSATFPGGEIRVQMKP